MMKKIILLIMILGLTSISFVNVKGASTYNGITLDTTLTDLGGYSLRQVFEDYNLLNVYNTYTDADDYVYFNNNGANIGSFSGSVPQGYIDFNINNNVDIYLSFTIKANQTNLVYWRFLDDNGVSYIYSDNFISGTYKTYSYIHTGLTLSNPKFSFYMTGATTSSDSHVILNEAFLIELDYLGITLNTTMLDYYKSLYIALKNDIDLTTFYNEGYSDAYFDGYDDGYEEGNLLGYNQGFNEGRDDAIDNNFTLMGLIELIIGVVLSMVGWIINIEIFNISIIGILSTLAVGIGIIWLLKILRG
jgi:hypothetical protein